MDELLKTIMIWYMAKLDGRGCVADYKVDSKRPFLGGPIEHKLSISLTWTGGISLPSEDEVEKWKCQSAIMESKWQSELAKREALEKEKQDLAEAIEMVASLIKRKCDVE